MKYFSFSLKQLKILQTIKKKINIKIAGKTLYLSQPALNLQIKTFEHNIGSKILVQKKDQTYFTPEGELILNYANQILNLCQEADNAIALFKKLKRFRLKIGSNKIIAKNISVKLTDLFCKRYSYAYVELKIGSTKSLSWDLINGKIDIAIVQEDEVPENLYHSLYCTPYFKEKIVLIMAKSQKQKYGNKIRTETLYKLNFLTLKPYLHERKMMDNNLKSFNINLKQLKIDFELNSIQAIKHGVRAGLGVSFLPAMLIKNELYSKQLDSIVLDSINTNRQFIIMVNLKKSDSYICEQFYNYCFIILKANIYNKFLNLS